MDDSNNCSLLQNYTTWVGEAKGKDITIEIYTDDYANRKGFTLSWERLDEPTTPTPTEKPDMCDNYGCSHACYINSDNAPECACPVGMDLQDDLMTCEDYSDDSNNEVSNSFINEEDNTWRPLLGFPTMCVTKKYRQYSVGQPYAMMECDNTKRKTKFAYNADTGLLHHQSDKEEWNSLKASYLLNMAEKLDDDKCGEKCALLKDIVQVKSISNTVLAQYNIWKQQNDQVYFQKEETDMTISYSSLKDLFQSLQGKVFSRVNS